MFAFKKNVYFEFDASNTFPQKTRVAKDSKDV